MISCSLPGDSGVGEVVWTRCCQHSSRRILFLLEFWLFCCSPEDAGRFTKLESLGICQILF
ncbi:hypothetical protein AVDCRST_MAG84-4092 [uncultured Microcoleus sp.]|uniref:Uncharacterized protein n=1 Tax=uncultured Microcoleus sp. TaxID=259945 RepID=A0A6J4MWU1_9CYAN|nr:hypothetical protein AVDCRST_MAG84-4092 [uncultured Microcoleus sp.]